MATEAKANGTSAIDFQKQIVSAMKQKGTEFLQARTAETAPAQDVAGDEPQRVTEDEEIKAVAAAVAGFASAYTGRDNGMY